jgi:ribonuclease PH
VEAGTLTAAPIRDFVAATSVGIVDGQVMLDLAYEEDSRAEVDMNFVLTGAKRIVEIQATAEQHPFDDEQLREMMQLARRGVESLIGKQRAILSGLTLRQ